MLLYVLPVVGITLIVSGVAAAPEQRFTPVGPFGVLSVLVVIVVRIWGSGYL